MANRYRDAMYVGVATHLPQRIVPHRNDTGSDFCTRRGLHRLFWAERGETVGDCIAHEKRLKRWHRQWKFDLIEKGNPEWNDLYDLLVRSDLAPEAKLGPGSRPGRRIGLDKANSARTFRIWSIAAVQWLRGWPGNYSVDREDGDDKSVDFRLVAVWLDPACDRCVARGNSPFA